MKFDYIVVGAGAAGSVLASRLSEDPNNNVLLVEYGGSDWNPLIYIPQGFYYTIRGELYAYRYSTQPAGPRGQREVWTRTKGLSGSTAVNGMMWTRGAAADWDGLEASGNPGWNWERALVAYRTIEDHNLGASDLRGAGGPLGVSVVEEDDEVVQAILAAAQGIGWEHVADTNASDGERIGFSPDVSPATVRRPRWRSPGSPPTSFLSATQVCRADRTRLAQKWLAPGTNRPSADPALKGPRTVATSTFRSCRHGTRPHTRRFPRNCQRSQSRYA